MSKDKDYFRFCKNGFGGFNFDMMMGKWWLSTSFSMPLWKSRGSWTFWFAPINLSITNDEFSFSIDATIMNLAINFNYQKKDFDLALFSGDFLDTLEHNHEKEQEN